MKIRKVCEKTSLSERTIRFYIEKGLISPSSYELNDRTYYDYEDKDLREIEQIATLRKIGFSISSLLAMKNDPQQIDDTVEMHRNAMEENAKQQADALNALRKTVEKRYSSLEELTETLTKDASGMELPKFDVWSNFAQFDEETREERENAYQDFLHRQSRRKRMSRALKPLRALLLCLCAMAFICGVIFGVSCIPHRIYQEFDGVELMMSGEGSNILQKTNIYIDGWLYNQLFVVPKFKGEFEISAYPYTIDNKIEMLFSDNMEQGYLAYGGIDNGRPKIDSLGVLYTDKNFSSLAIHLFDINNQADGSRGGSTGNRVIVAPASRSEEASDILLERDVYWMDFTGVWHYPH